MGIRQTHLTASPPNGSPIPRPRSSLSLHSSAPITINQSQAPLNSLSPEKHSASSPSSKIPPWPNSSSFFATSPVPRPRTVPAAFFTPVFPPTASKNRASWSSISIASRILLAPTLPFPPARSPLPATAFPSPFPSASSAITIDPDSVFGSKSSVLASKSPLQGCLLFSFFCPSLFVTAVPSPHSVSTNSSSPLPFAFVSSLSYTRALIPP